MIRFENITYRYDGDNQPALLNVSLEIGVGESACIMGANGSGKSTLARIAAGLLKTQQGRLSVNVEKNHPISVGLLFQNPDNQMIAVTVEKEIAFALENLGIKVSEMEKRIDRMLSNLSITHLRNRLTSELSVGEKQRVALASLLVFRPPVLVLDEPDSFLDAEGRTLFRKLLERIKSKTPELIVLEITQYSHIAQNYERLIVLNKGRVAADGPPSEIFRNKSFCLNCGLEFDFVTQKEIGFPDGAGLRSKNASDIVDHISFERVSFKYPGSDNFVLKNISTRFNKSEITAIAGPSASGKSTLAMLLCGVLKPDAGVVNWLNNDSKSIANDKISGKVTAALQQPERQFFLHTCQDEVEFGPNNFGIRLERKILQQMFEVVGLSFEQFYQRDPFTLSLGEKRRLALSSVLSIFPDFIVFDEPTVALDREGVGRFMLLARQLKKSGRGVVVISHDDEIIKALADKIVLLDGNGNFQSLSSEQYFENAAVEPNPVLKQAN